MWNIKAKNTLPFTHWSFLFKKIFALFLTHILTRFSFLSVPPLSPFPCTVGVGGAGGGFLKFSSGCSPPSTPPPHPVPGMVLNRRRGKSCLVHRLWPSKINQSSTPAQWPVSEDPPLLITTTPKSLILTPSTQRFCFSRDDCINTGKGPQQTRIHTHTHTYIHTYIRKHWLTHLHTCVLAHSSFVHTQKHCTFYGQAGG